MGRYCPRPCNNQLLSHDCPCSSFHVLPQSVREEREMNRRFTISIAWSLSLWFLPVWQIEVSNNPHKLEKLQENFEYATAPAELLREFSTVWLIEHSVTSSSMVVGIFCDEQFCCPTEINYAILRIFYGQFYFAHPVPCNLHL